MSRRRQAGFSLMEVLVGLTLLAFISVAVSQTMRTGIRLWQASSKDDKAAELDRTSEMIERWIARALPPKAFEPDLPPVFVGRADQMTFLLDGQAGRKMAGYSRVTLAARANRNCEAGRDLVLVWEDVSSAGNFASQASDARVLISCAANIQFDYAGATQSFQGAQLVHSEVWNNSAQLPGFVSITAEGRDGSFRVASRLRFSR